MFAIRTYTWTTENVSAVKRMDRNLSKTAVTSVVAPKISGGSDCPIKLLYVLKMQSGRGIFNLETWPRVVLRNLNIGYFLVKSHHPSTQIIVIVE